MFLYSGFNIYSNNPKKKISQKEIFLKLIYIKCFHVSTEVNQFLLHTFLISHQNPKYVMTNRPLSKLSHHKKHEKVPKHCSRVLLKLSEKDCVRSF